MLALTDMQKIGIGLTGFGVFFLFLGMLFFFDGGLLAMGNVLFISGLALLIGINNTFSFFFQPRPQKIKGSVCFFGGVLLVLTFSAVLGMILELVGLYFLFSDFLPVVLGFLKRLPVVGVILQAPGLSKVGSYTVIAVVTSTWASVAACRFELNFDHVKAQTRSQSESSASSWLGIHGLLVFRPMYPPIFRVCRLVQLVDSYTGPQLPV